MNRLKRVIRNIIILAVLLFIFIKSFGLYLTPISAHEHSERSIHYGPSEVVHVEDFEKGKYILCKYDRWVSCNTVNRTLFFFWRFGNQATGFENDKSKALGYTWEGSYQYYKLYGIINDSSIKKIEVTLSNGAIFTQTDFYDDMFLLTWKLKDKEDLYSKSIKGYDANNNIIFQEER
jgi:hypothetical protein